MPWLGAVPAGGDPQARAVLGALYGRCLLAGPGHREPKHGRRNYRRLSLYRFSCGLLPRARGARLRHDARNHIGVLRGLMDAGEKSAALAYAQALADEYSDRGAAGGEGR